MAMRAMGTRSSWLAAVAALALGMAGLAAAQQTAPTARAVRLSSVDGQVQIAQGGQVLADQAPANTPLFEGTQITTGDDGRAEVQLEDGTVARISPNSVLTLTRLGQQGNTLDTEFALMSGLGYFETPGDSDTSRVRVRFGNNVLSASGFTVIRVNVDTPPGLVAVFSGNAHLEDGASLALDLHGGESVRLNAQAPNNYLLAESIEPDSWDAWNADRDQALTTEEAAKTQATADVTNPNNPAWSDLDANGNWYNVPGKGYVWSPYAAQTAGWDPYGCGNWVWTPLYGYIWVSCEPWGYMPYVAGMWEYYDGFGWGWYPGGGPWWGTGYGWGYNVNHNGFKWSPPGRPHGGPVGPGGGDPRHRSDNGAYPVVAVNHFKYRNNTVAPRGPNTPVTIAGATVMPMRSVVTTRPVYNGISPVGGTYRGSMGYAGAGMGRTAGVYSGAIRSGTNTRSGYAGPTILYASPNSSIYAGSRGAVMGSTGARPGGQPPAPRPTPGSGGGGARMSSGGGASAGAPRSAPAPSFSGGGGSAPHPSSGSSPHH